MKYLKEYSNVDNREVDDHIIDILRDFVEDNDIYRFYGGG